MESQEVWSKKHIIQLKIKSGEESGYVRQTWGQTFLT